MSSLARSAWTVVHRNFEMGEFMQFYKQLCVMGVFAG